MEERIKMILAEIKNDEALAETLTSSSSITDDVGLDSLQMINFMLKIQDEFGVEIDFEDFDFSHLNSIKTFCDFIGKGN